jgi:hypothetical protein
MNSLLFLSSFLFLTVGTIISCNGLSLYQYQHQRNPLPVRHHRVLTTSNDIHRIDPPLQRQLRYNNTQQSQQRKGHVATHNAIVPRLHSSWSSSSDVSGSASIAHQVDDDAKTLPQLMKSLWSLISYASKNMYRGVSFIVSCSAIQPFLRIYLVNLSLVSLFLL